MKQFMCHVGDVAYVFAKIGSGDGTPLYRVGVFGRTCTTHIRECSRTEAAYPGLDPEALSAVTMHFQKQGTSYVPVQRSGEQHYVHYLRFFETGFPIIDISTFAKYFDLIKRKGWVIVIPKIREVQGRAVLIEEKGLGGGGVVKCEFVAPGVRVNLSEAIANMFIADKRSRLFPIRGVDPDIGFPDMKIVVHGREINPLKDSFRSFGESFFSQLLDNCLGNEFKTIPVLQKQGRAEATINCHVQFIWKKINFGGRHEPGKHMPQQKGPRLYFCIGPTILSVENPTVIPPLERLQLKLSSRSAGGIVQTSFNLCREAVGDLVPQAKSPAAKSSDNLPKALYQKLEDISKINKADVGKNGLRFLAGLNAFEIFIRVPQGYVILNDPKTEITTDTSCIRNAVIAEAYKIALQQLPQEIRDELNDGEPKGQDKEVPPPPPRTGGAGGASRTTPAVVPSTSNRRTPSAKVPDPIPVQGLVKTRSAEDPAKATQAPPASQAGPSGVRSPRTNQGAAAQVPAGGDPGGQGLRNTRSAEGRGPAPQAPAQPGPLSIRTVRSSEGGAPASERSDEGAGAAKTQPASRKRGGGDDVSPRVGLRRAASIFKCPDCQKVVEAGDEDVVKRRRTAADADITAPYEKKIETLEREIRTLKTSNKELKSQLNARI